MATRSFILQVLAATRAAPTVEVRLTSSLFAILVCLVLIQASARFGMSRMFARYALIANNVPAADAAVEFAPSDPEAHRARATVFNSLQRPDEAATSLEHAVTLRYRDDYLWIELANTREELGDTQAALAALDQAVHWAPYYAHTRWQRGNLLLRMGRANVAFVDLRSAATADPRYAPNLIDLAWGISRNDVKTTEALLNIKNDDERLSLIWFLAGKGRGREVLDQILLLDEQLYEKQRDEVAQLLYRAKAFKESFDVSHPYGNFREPIFVNGGFEEPLVLADSGFGWIISAPQKNRLAIDVSEKLSGSKSLQINLDGSWPPGASLLSQTFIVKPGETYRLSFSVKTKDLVTGGPPVIVVNDASNDQLLGKSENFPTATTSWSELTFSFTTLPTSEAAVIRLQRNNCDTSPCPIFGTLWLDGFSFEQTDPPQRR